MANLGGLMLKMERQIIKKGNSTSSVKGRRVLVVILCLIAVLQSGLRDLSNLPSGNDTPRYQMKYIQMKNVSWSSVMNDFAIVSNEYSGRDSGYEVFMKLTQYIWSDFTFFMFITAIAFIVPFGMLIYKYVKSYLGIILVYMIYFSIFTTVTNSFMRQAAALGITLFAIRYIISRNWKYYYGLMFIALSVHSSAIAAFPFYFLPMLCKSKKWLIMSFVASPILVLFLKPLMSYFLAGSVYDRYVSAEMVNPINYTALIVSIALLSIIFYEKVRVIEDNKILISSVFGIMILLPVVFMGNSLLRISYYYVFVLILLLPVVIDLVKMPKTVRISTYLVLISFFIFMMFRK